MATRKLEDHPSICDVCRVSFYRPKNHKQSARVFCSKQCSMRRHGTPEERFWSYVIKNEHGCWGWSGPKNPVRQYEEQAYGRFIGRPNGKRILAHVFSWELHYGKVPEGENVLHKCDNPSCTRPDHLFTGTQITNIEDRHKKGRDSRGETHKKHKFTEKQVILIRWLLGNYCGAKRIAKFFSTSSTAVRRIWQRKSWGWLPESEPTEQEIKETIAELEKTRSIKDHRSGRFRKHGAVTFPNSYK